MPRPRLSFDNGNASEATIWVCQIPNCALPYVNETLETDSRQGMSLGIHLESRSVVLHFSKVLTHQHACQRLEAALGKGGALQRCVQGMEALDLYDAEEWGLVQLNAPMLPDSDDELIEGDEISDVESVAVEETQAQASEPDLFALAIPSAKPIRVPDALETLDIATQAEEELRADFESAGPLTPYLQEHLFPRSLGHTRSVQDKQRSLARTKSEVDVIRWVTPAPECITVYGKPKMALKRRVEWIQWKAAKLNMELTPCVCGLSETGHLHQRL